MPLPTSIDDLSTVPGDNFPQGTDSPDVLDNVIREHAAYIAELRDGQDSAIRDDLASPASGKGAEMVVTSDGRTVQEFIDDSKKIRVLAKPFGLNTAGVQAAFNHAATVGACELVFDGIYTLTNPRTDNAFTAAVVISGLKNCRVYGTPGTRFNVAQGGTGTAEFAHFRIEQCTNVVFSDFEMDGSGITNTGTGANRSNGFICVNFNVNSTTTDFPIANSGLEFHHVYCHDIGGFVTVHRRSMSLAATPQTIGLSVHDNLLKNLVGVDHGVSCPHTSNVVVYNNRFINDIAAVTVQDNMAVDASSGATNCHIYNNYVYGFVFGMKCESVTGVGPSGTDEFVSSNVLFENNVLEEIGSPSTLVWPGPSGGDTYGIKVNGVNCAAVNNTIKKRTIGVTAGGLSIGIVATATHSGSGHVEVGGNAINGTSYGILHNSPPVNAGKTVARIFDNSAMDCTLYGALVQGNCHFYDNTIYRSNDSAVVLQVPSQTFVYRNTAIDCATANNTVISAPVVFYQQGTGTVGYFEFTDNRIVDGRGAAAADYGYFLHAGTNVTNSYVLSAGISTGLLVGITFDKYFSSVGTTQKLDAVTTASPRTFYANNSPALIPPWNTRTWRVGDRAIMEVPSVGVPKGWVCTVAGTPGTWVSEGNL